ncbi:oxidoreductase,short chain dehydrogenase-like protein [Boeremia exigua]|uniref:oxidoreductase,short chain dehydrogenase-like protein n=1 Tax=Boeremia exigua TaxID=749465 RepID=UPI001E8DE0FA|nr:oxidoreductase,short chain dehydrogenase-like protein [Boeremia exigua]KAH6616846.1 oxidoreductase,short chain dehydrogenase-like protein [Boeremia exigua]
MSDPQVWLITGASTGFGAALVKSLLVRGEKVIATARTLSKIEHLGKLGAATLQLDVTASTAELEKIAREAIAVYGRIDVLVNNAGYGHFGTFEEATHQDWLAQFNTNVFGAVNVTRSFLPHFRSNKSGTVVFNGSATAINGFGILSLYSASKFALTGVAESLAQEVAPFGIRTLIVQPGLFRTDFLTETNTTYSGTKIDGYQTQVDEAFKLYKGVSGQQPGDPIKGANRIIDMVKGEGLAKGKDLPTTLMLGEDSWGMAKKKAEDQLKLLSQWEEASCNLSFE